MELEHILFFIGLCLLIIVVCLGDKIAAAMKSNRKKTTGVCVLICAAFALCIVLYVQIRAYRLEQVHERLISQSYTTSTIDVGGYMYSDWTYFYDSVNDIKYYFQGYKITLDFLTADTVKCTRRYERSGTAGEWTPPITTTETYTLKYTASGFDYEKIKIILENGEVLNIWFHYYEDWERIETPGQPQGIWSYSIPSGKVLDAPEELKDMDTSHKDRPKKDSGSSSKGKCPNCNGTGYVKYYYGSSDLEAYLSGHDPYTTGKCQMCGGTGKG